MKTILKLLVAAIVINAAVRGAVAGLHYYQLKDAAQQAVLFGASDPTADIQQQIVARAQELRLPIRPDNVLVQRDGGRTWANASYTQQIEFFPNQKYPVDFSFSVEGRSMVLAPSNTTRR
jgi:hypothetical protein